MTAYTGSIDTTLELNDGVTDLWTLSDEDSAESGFDSGDSSGLHDEYYYIGEFPLETFEGVYEGSVEMTEASGGVGTLLPGEYCISNADGFEGDTLYIRMSDDGNPDDSSADTISIEQKAHYNLLQFIKEKMLLNGWELLREDLSSENHEIILVGEGYSGTDEIYVGFYTYQSVSNDYYNMSIATMKGYTAGNTFLTQPGIKYSSFCCHNIEIGYWLSINAARINGCLKVGTPVYEHFGAGNIIPYAPPSQYPQPLFNCGTLVGMAATRYSDTSHSMGWKGSSNTFILHKNDGNWYYGSSLTVDADQRIAFYRPLNSTTRPTDVTYVVVPLTLYDLNKNVYGELDGIYLITGFDNVVENTLVIDAENYVVLQDGYRTGFDDYIAMKLN